MKLAIPSRKLNIKHLANLNPKLTNIFEKIKTQKIFSSFNCYVNFFLEYKTENPLWWFQIKIKIF